MISHIYSLSSKQSISNNFQFLYSFFFYSYLSYRYNISFIRTKCLVSILSALSVSKSTNIHILGSGSSVLNTIKYINTTDIVIGNNMSCLLDINHHIYFAEFCGNKIADFSRGMFSIVEQNRHKLKYCFFKNLRAQYNEPSEAFLDYQKLDFQFIADQSMSCINPSDVDLLLKSFFDFNYFLPQFKSTVLSVVFLCYLAGYRNIVLHGFDFGGPYFFDTSHWYSISDVRVNTFIPRDSFYPVAHKNTQHLVSKGAVPLSTVLDAINHSFYYKSLNLRHANA